MPYRNSWRPSEIVSLGILLVGLSCCGLNLTVAQADHSPREASRRGTEHKAQLKQQLSVQKTADAAEETIGMAGQEVTPLTAVPGWDKAYIDKLAESWITTAEQVVGVAATANGITSLAQQLGVSEEEMHRLIDSARAALPPAVAKELEKEVDTSQYGLGALPPVAPPKPRRP